MKKLVFVFIFITTITYNMNALASNKCDKSTVLLFEAKSTSLDKKTKKLKESIVTQKLTHISHQLAGDELLLVKSNKDFKDVTVLGKTYSLTKTKAEKLFSFATIADLNVLSLAEAKKVIFLFDDKKGSTCQLEVMYNVAD